MKKNIVVSIIFIFSFLICKSQTRRIELGFLGGINGGSLYGPGSDFGFYNQYKKRMVGGVVGLQFKYRFSKRFALKTIFQLEQNGYILSDRTLEDHSGNPYGQGDEISKQSYLNIPLVTEFSFGNKIMFNTNAGLFVGVSIKDIFITKVKQRFIPPGQPPALEIFKQKNYNHNSFNTGISFGTGVVVPLTQKIKLSINLQDNLGLINISNDDQSSDHYIKTNSISFVTGVTYSL